MGWNDFVEWVRVLEDRFMDWVFALPDVIGFPIFFMVIGLLVVLWLVAIAGLIGLGISVRDFFRTTPSYIDEGTPESEFELTIGKRFRRILRQKTDECSFCHQPKRYQELGIVPGRRWICESCSDRLVSFDDRGMAQIKGETVR